MKNFLTALFIFVQFITFSRETAAQIPAGTLSPTVQANPVKPYSFYISSIYDERIGADSIGTLLFSTNEKSVTHKIALQASTLVGITKVLSNNVTRNTSLLPVSIRIKECKTEEILSGNDRVLGQVKLELWFDLEKESGSIPLTRYTSSAKYTRSLTNLSIVEPTFQTVLLKSLTFINGWIKAEAPVNPKLAKGLKLTIHDYLEQHDDTIYYQASRPLIWDDFREKRSSGSFAASVFPSFGYDQRTKMEDGYVNVDLALKVFVVKSASWVGPGSRSKYNLNHEQRHFDLVRLVADRFKKKLLSEQLTPENYQGIINFEYLEFYREMNKVQQEYDEQTSHGTSMVIQEFWNRKIDLELSLINNSHQN